MSPSPESPTPHACPSEGRSRPVVRAGSFLLLLLGCAPAATPPTGRVSPQLPMGDPRIPSEQAVLAFDMSTRTADGRLRDLTLNGLHGVVRGTTPVSGPDGGAMRFAAVTDRVELPSRAWLDLDGPLSVVARFRIERSGQHQHVVACDDKFALWITPADKVRFVNTLGDGAETVAPLDEGEWHSVIGVFRGTAGDAIDTDNVEIWIDGVRSAVTVGSARRSGTAVWVRGTLHPSDACAIGFESHQGNAAHQQLPFHGAIDELVLFSRALSAEEIGRLAASGS